VPILSHLALASGVVDFAGHHRTDADWLAGAWSAPHTRVLLLCGDTAPVRAGNDGVVWLPPRLVDEIAAGGERLFLGVDDDGTARFCVVLPAAAGPALLTGLASHPDMAADAAGLGFGSLRDVGGDIDATDASWFAPAVALARWHDNHPCCARCGAKTQIAQAGHTRECPACGAEHFPRTDPAIIVLVTDADGRALLGHGAAWPAGRYSTLAGFVEPGESIEAAVVREVAEETGVRVLDPVYAGSQPWPFPASLMLGFFGRAADTRIVTDGIEVTAAHWFTRAELAAETQAGRVQLPSGVSISHRLIAHWYGGPLPTGPDR
jgi:NAD+ diphosphatase